MARIGPRDTAPEMKLRRMLLARGWRSRLHAKGLPGIPDLVFPVGIPEEASAVV